MDLVSRHVARCYTIRAVNVHISIKCPKCRETKTIYVVGGWDIKNVTHNCPRDGFTYDPAKPPFAVVYAPPRRVF